MQAHPRHSVRVNRIPSRQTFRHRLLYTSLLPKFHFFKSKVFFFLISLRYTPPMSASLSFPPSRLATTAISDSCLLFFPHTSFLGSLFTLYPPITTLTVNEIPVLYQSNIYLELLHSLSFLHAPSISLCLFQMMLINSAFSELIIPSSSQRISLHGHQPNVLINTFLH